MKLQLTNGYYLEFTQLSRLINYIQEQNNSRISLNQLSDTLGLAKTQIKNLASLAIAISILRRGSYSLKPFGQLVVEHDPFFEEIGTLWYSHYNLGFNSKWVIWNRMVNNILPNHPFITNGLIKQEFIDLSETYAPRSFQIHFPKEVRVFFDAYTNQDLSKLRYLIQEADTYKLSNKPAPISKYILLAMIFRYRNFHFPKDTAIGINRITGADNSPGRVCNQPEHLLRLLLEELHSEGLISIESRGDLDQVRFTTTPDEHQALRLYYNRSR